MPLLTARDIARTCAGRVVGDGGTAVATIVGDSREAVDGAGFAAIRGGHAFVGDALQRGARLAIVEREEAVPAGSTAIIVADVVDALSALAREVRSRLQVRCVGITGSTGKTLTKDFIAAAAAARFRVHAAPRSFNNEVGVPLVVLSCPDDADVLVVEMGARHRGDIEKLASIARCDIGVITGIGKTHLGEFGTRKAIASTKAELLRSLPASGLAVVPSDDDFLPVLSDSTIARKLTVGPGGQVRFRAAAVERPGRTVGTVTSHGHAMTVTLPVPGRALLRNAAVAIAVAGALGVPGPDAADAMARSTPTSWRMQVVPIGPWTVVNDAYNANPTSMTSALRTVKELGTGSPVWAVLGEMAELGTASSSEHVRVGRLAAALDYQGVIAVGDGAALIASAAGSIATSAASMEEAADLAIQHIPAGAYVLVKGSLVTGLKEFTGVLSDKLRAIPSFTGGRRGRRPEERTP